MTKSEIRIESGVPMPGARNQKGRSHHARKYPFFDMKVGDSFVVLHRANNVRMAARYHGEANQPGFKVSVRRDKDGQMRCWRIK